MRILDHEIPMKENLQGSLRQYRYIWMALIVTVILDFVTTIMFMRNDGIQYEANLLVRWLAITLGIIPGVFIGKSLQIFAAVMFSALSIKLARATLLLILLLNIMAIIVNLL